MAFAGRCCSVALLALAFCNASANAETLQRLTVTQLTLTADTANPHIETPFHLVVTARVRERVTEIDNVNLPLLAELELLGDEHSITASESGTVYRETITVIAHHTGAITIEPVTLDAIDARDGKAKRYFSNALTISVGGLSVVSATVDIWGAIGSFFLALFKLVLWLLGIAAILAVVAAVMRRRPPPAQPVVTLAPPTPVERDPRAVLREALGALQHDPTRAGAMQARHVVRGMVGASDTETLADVLQRPNVQDPRLRATLAALERAGFTHDADLAPAIAAAIAELERMTR
jgi:hypothetical protein